MRLAYRQGVTTASPHHFFGGNKGRIKMPASVDERAGGPILNPIEQSFGGKRSSLWNFGFGRHATRPLGAGLCGGGHRQAELTRALANDRAAMPALTRRISAAVQPQSSPSADSRRPARDVKPSLRPAQWFQASRVARNGYLESADTRMELGKCLELLHASGRLSDRRATACLN
jgi:hypothetical protein